MRDNFLTELFQHPLDPGYAEAARRKVDRPPPARWRTAGNRSVLLATFVVIGFLLAVAYQHAVAAKPSATKAREDLVGDVRDRRAQTEQLQQQAERLRDEVSKARDDALADRGAGAGLRDLAAGTGLGKVTGDGVVVRLADGPAPVDPVTGKTTGDNPGLVLDRDLQDIANALWQAGAEAVAVGGQRLTATSTIRQAGGAILVDFRPVASPYDIIAIGPGDMAGAFSGSATAKRFDGYTGRYHMQFGVKARKGLTLAAGPEPRLRYATPGGR